MSVFNLPDLGEGLAEAEIAQWLVRAGDEVSVDTPLVSVETDKAVVDIPSPQAGQIQRLCAQVGDVVRTGEPLLEFAQGKRENVPDSGTVVGTVTTSDDRIEELATPVNRKDGGAVKALPAVRALARKLGVDLSVVSPSGPEESVTAEDVNRVARRLKELGPLELLRGPRRTMAMKMAQAGAEVVPATLFDDANIHHWPQQSNVNVRLLRAMAAACRSEPSLNAWYDAHSLGRRVLGNIDIAIAVDSKDGLFTPVVRDVAGLSDAELAAEIERLKKQTAGRSIEAQQMRDYTITLSNFGMISGRYAMPVVVPPTVAILGAGRIVERAVVLDDEVVIRRLLPLSLTFDHRAVTGGEAARFMAALLRELER